MLSRPARISKEATGGSFDNLKSSLKDGKPVCQPQAAFSNISASWPSCLESTLKVDNSTYYISSAHSRFSNDNLESTLEVFNLCLETVTALGVSNNTYSAAFPD